MSAAALAVVAPAGGESPIAPTAQELGWSGRVVGGRIGIVRGSSGNEQAFCSKADEALMGDDDVVQDGNAEQRARMSRVLG